MAVIEEELSDSDEDYGPGPAEIFMAVSGDGDGDYWRASSVFACPAVKAQDCLMALSDTCCARSVAGEAWASAHMEHLHAAGLDVYVVNEARPFRFGAGPRIMSKYSIVFPLNLPGASSVPWIRVSVVDQEVPLLMSKAALKSLGACLDLGAARIGFNRLGTSLELIETDAGLCGFVINKERSQGLKQPEFPPEQMIDGEMEVSNEEAGDPRVPASEPLNVHVCPDPKPQDAHHECERVATQRLAEGDFTYESLEGLLSCLPTLCGEKQRSINQLKNPRTQGLMAGLWAHGGLHGLTRNTETLPNTIRYLNLFMRDKVGEDRRWTSIAVFKNVKMNIHKDRHNETQSVTTTVTCGDFQGGQLWIADPTLDSTDPARALRKDRRGNMVPGKLVDTRYQPYFLDPKTSHSTQAWTGTRWCISCFTSRAVTSTDRCMRRSLRRLGFPLRSMAKTRTSGNNHLAFSTSSVHQEPLSNRDEVCGSPNMCTPCEAVETTLAQPKASIDSSEVRSLGDYREGPDEQVHHAQEEGRVCGGDRRADRFGQRGVETPRLRASQADLDYGQASEATVASAVGWKKLDVAALKELYATEVREDLNRPDDSHWVRWRRPTLVTEIDMWLADVMADMPEEDLYHDTPLCGVCKIPMVRRTSRLTKTDFYGCVRFPLCTQTLPLTYGGQPTKEVQDALKEEEETHRWQPTKGKHKGYPKFEKEKKIEKDNPVRRKAATAVADSRGSSSDGSWVRAGTIPIQESSDENEEKDPVKPLYNTNVTEEELAILKEMRLAKKNEEK